MAVAPRADAEMQAASTLPVSAVPPAAPPPLPAAAVLLNSDRPYAPPRRPHDEPRRRIVWAAWAQGDERESFDVARATPRQLEMVYWLACLLPFAAIFSAAPAVPHIQFAGAPFWAQVLLGIACLQFAYAAWLATVPDWSGVRVGTYLLAGIASFELLAAVALLLLPETLLMLAGLAGARTGASAWCGLAAAVSGLSCASCRWLDRRWRGGQI